MRFDQTGGLWVAMKYGMEGPLELPVVDGPCRLDAISASRDLERVLVRPVTESGGPVGSNSSLVFDSKEARIPQANRVMDDPSFLDPEGHVVWVAPNSQHLGDLWMEPASRDLLVSVRGLSIENVRILFPQLQAEFLPKDSLMTVKGLPNLGNTCYFNSAIQVLFRISLFREFIKDAPVAFQYLSEESTTGQLAKLFREMEKPGNIRDAISEETMALLLLSLQPYSPVGDLLQQNDPEEAITTLFSAVDAETDASPWMSTSTIRQLGQVKMIEEDHCRCGGRDSQTPILGYSFKLGEVLSDGEDDLERLVQAALFPNPLRIEGHERHENRRQLVIESLPPILAFHVNRRTMGGEKNRTAVRFPLRGLDMTPYVRGYAGAPLVYDFTGAVMHKGGLLAGHYTAGITFPDCWYEISDGHHGKRHDLHKRLRRIEQDAVLLVFQLRSTISEKELHNPEVVRPETFHKTKEQTGHFDYRRYELEAKSKTSHRSTKDSKKKMKKY